MYIRNHKKEIQEYKKAYRQENKEKLSEKGKEKYICECVSECRIGHKLRHYKTKRHIDFISDQGRIWTMSIASTIDIPS